MARQVLVLQLIVVLVLVVTALALATYDARNDIRASARDEAVSVARAVARSPVVREAMATSEPTALLQPYAEAVRVEGESPWYAAPHDEFAIVMDGEVTFRFVKLADDQVPHHEGGAVRLGGVPNGPAMGRVTARRGHQVLLPKGAAYQLSAGTPAVAIVQTRDGPETVKRWSEICTLA